MSRSTTLLAFVLVAALNTAVEDCSGQPPLPPLPGVYDWALDSRDLLLTRIFDDPASTPKQVGDAMAVQKEQLKDLPSSLWESFGKRVIGHFFAALKQRLPENSRNTNNVQEELIDRLSKLLEDFVNRIVPERNRPTHKQRLESLVQSLKERHPQADEVIDYFSDIAIEFLGPYLADTTLFEDFIQLAAAHLIYIDDLRRLNRPNPITERIPQDELKRIVKELQTGVTAERSQELRHWLGDVIQQTIRGRAGAKATTEEQRRRQEYPNTITSGPSYGGNYNSDGFRSGGSSAPGITIKPPGPDNVTFPDGSSANYDGGFGGGGASGGYGGSHLGAEMSPPPATSELAMAFQGGFLANSEAGQYTARDSQTSPDADPGQWYLPKQLAPTGSRRFASPLIQTIHRECRLAAFEYYADQSRDKQLASVFVADSSATLEHYPGVVSTCNQTTFGFRVEDIYRQGDLLVYRFADPRGFPVFGAQWASIIADGFVRLSNPVIPPSTRFPARTRILTHQVLTAEPRLIRSCYETFLENMTHDGLEIIRPDDPVPMTWIRDAELVRDRLTVDIAHRGVPETAEVLIKYWQRTYAAADEPPMRVSVPLEHETNILSVSLPWPPGACSVEVRSGDSRSLCFLQRELVPLGDTRLVESIGTRQLRPDLIPLLGHLRGVRLTGIAPRVLFPVGSFKRRIVDLNKTRSVVVDLEVSAAALFEVRIRRRSADEPLGSVPRWQQRIDPGHHLIDIPWEKFSEIPTRAFAIVLTATPVASEARLEMQVRQIAISTKKELGRHLAVGDLTFDFGHEPRAALVGVTSAERRDRLQRLLFGPHASSSKSEPAAMCRQFVRLDMLDGGSTAQVNWPADDHPSSDGSAASASPTLSMKAPPSRTSLALFTPDAGFRSIWRAPGDHTCYLAPAESGKTLAIIERRLGRWEWSAGARRIAFAVSAGVFAFLALVYFRRRAAARAGLALIVSFAAMAGLAMWADAPRASNRGAWPFGQPPLAVFNTPTASVLPTIAPTVIDPIPPGAGLEPPRSARPECDRPGGKVFADFSNGDRTAVGTTFGGFADQGAACQALPIAAPGSRNGHALQISITVPSGSYGGVWLKNPPIGGITLNDYRAFRFEAVATKAQASCRVEFKLNSRTIGACRAVIPPGEWQTLDIPLLDVIPDTERVGGFDELVFRFDESAQLLVGHLQFVP